MENRMDESPRGDREAGLLELGVERVQVPARDPCRRCEPIRGVM
jgi:hypothetical protein